MAIHFSTLRLWRWIALALIATSVSTAVSPPVQASDDGAIVGGILNILVGAAKAERQRKAFDASKRHEGPVIGCLRQQYRIEPNNLVQQGIGPDDRRARPFIAKGEEAVRIARAARARRFRIAPA